MTSSVLLLVVFVASFTSLASSDGVSDNQPPLWHHLNENGTYVTRDWRKSITTKIVLSSTKRPILPTRSSPKPTERRIVTKPTQPPTMEPTKPTRRTTIIGNRRPRPQAATVATTATATGVTHSDPAKRVTPNTGDKSTVSQSSRTKTEAATDAVDKSTTTTTTTTTYTTTEAPKLVTGGKKGKDSPNDLAYNSAPTVRLSAVLTAFVSAALLLVLTTN